MRSSAGKALELWVLPARATMATRYRWACCRPAATQHRVLSAAQRAALAGAKQLAVSLEPAGGSPTGLPTGPVLHVAPCSSLSGARFDTKINGVKPFSIRDLRAPAL